CRRQRFGEHRMLQGNPIRQHVQIALGHYEELREGAGLIHDSEYGPLRAVTPQSFAAPIALRAAEIDFSHDTLAQQLGCVCFNHLTYELMPWSAGEAVVSSLQFEIGVADAAEQ